MQIQASLKVMPSMATRVEVYDKVNEVIKMIADSGLKFQSGASETTVEGEFRAIMNLVEQIHTKLVNDEVEQITMMIVTDYNKDAQYIDEKLNNVQEYLKAQK